MQRETVLAVQQILVVHFQRFKVHWRPSSTTMCLLATEEPNEWSTCQQNMYRGNCGTLWCTAVIQPTPLKESCSLWQFQVAASVVGAIPTLGNGRSWLWTTRSSTILGTHLNTKNLRWILSPWLLSEKRLQAILRNFVMLTYPKWHQYNFHNNKWRFESKHLGNWGDK